MHIAAFAQYVPFPTDNLQLWLRADSVGLTDGRVSRWFDLSHNRYEIVQTNAAARPTLSSDLLNGQPVLTFNGAQQLVGQALPLLNQNWTFFVVARTFAKTGSEQLLVGNGASGGGTNRYRLGIDCFASTNHTPTPTSWAGQINNNTFHIIDFECRNDELRGIFRINNNLVATIAYNAAFGNNTGNLKIGAYDNPTTLSLNGQIAEIIAFNTVDSTLRSQVYSYLYNKYALTTVNLGLDIHSYSFADTAINTAYNHNFVSYLWSTGETDSVIHVSKPGKYWVTVTNAFGYSSSDTINVFYPEPAQLRDTTICAGDAIVWSTGLDGPYTYLWSDGSTESSIEITTAGEYFVTITDTLGFSWKSDTITVKVDSFPVTAIIYHLPFII